MDFITAGSGDRNRRPIEADSGYLNDALRRGDTSRLFPLRFVKEISQSNGRPEGVVRAFSNGWFENSQPIAKDDDIERNVESSFPRSRLNIQNSLA